MNFVSLIPTFLKPVAHEVRYRFFTDKAEEILAHEVEAMQAQWRAIMSNSEEFIAKLGHDEETKHVLFVTGYGVGSHFLAIEPTIAMALYARGCKISSLYCNKSLPSCEHNAVGNNKPEVLTSLRRGVTDEAITFRCNKCKSNVETTYGILPIDLHGNDEFLTGADYQLALRLSSEVDFETFRDFIYEGVRVGEEAFASVLRATFMGEVSDTPLNRFLVKRYVMSGVLTTIAYSRAYESLKPDRVVCIHGVYQTHGLAVKVANKLNIPVVVLGGGGIRKDTVLVCHNESYHRQLISSDNSEWQQFKVSEEEKKKTFDYALQKRSSGAGVDYISYHPNPIEDVESLYRECGIDASRKIVSLYTNVIWDAQIFYDGNAFRNIFDWIETSIIELGKNEKVWGVIRIHPAEVKGGSPSRQPMLAEIQKRFPKLPENIRIIPPESDISSYTLAKESVANIIYGTKMGLEIALMKKPLIICGETFSRNKGYGLDITSKQEYIDLMREIHNYTIDVEEKLDIALQYAHYYYFRKMIDLPMETFNAGVAGAGKELKFDSIADIAQGKHEGMDVLCNGIMNLKPFYIGAE